MSKKDNDIEQLFSKKFEKFEVRSSDQEWLELSSKLSKVNFLKFSLVTFNVYYLTLLVTFAGTITFTGIRNIQLNHKIQKLEQTIQTYQKNEDVNSPSKFIDSTKLQNDEIVVNKSENEVVDKIKVKKNSAPKENVKTTKIETDVLIQSSNNTQVEVKENAVKPEVAPITDSVSKPKFRKVKKTLVVKPQPVVVKDTVVITRRLK